jgi:hypothetical protein
VVVAPYGGLPLHEATSVPPASTLSLSVAGALGEHDVSRWRRTRVDGNVQRTLGDSHGTADAFIVSMSC